MTNMYSIKGANGDYRFFVGMERLYGIEDFQQCVFSKGANLD